MNLAFLPDFAASRNPEQLAYCRGGDHYRNPDLDVYDHILLGIRKASRLIDKVFN